MLRQRQVSRDEDSLPHPDLQTIYQNQKKTIKIVEDERSINESAKNYGPRKAMSQEEVARDEGKLQKILVRLVTGLAMMAVFTSFLYMGHVWTCGLIIILEALLFRELVKVRYNTFFHIIEDKIPLFCTTQGLWFVVAILVTYSDFIVDIIKSNSDLHYLFPYAVWNSYFQFATYSITFVITIATLQPDHIKFQLNQLCWTIICICIIVGQLKYIMHNIFNGLIWFVLPIMLVVTNDTFSYLVGTAFGRKFIQRKLNDLSPNKTWEGFIGGGICTTIVAWHFSKIMANFTWMICPTNEFSLFPKTLDCDPDPIFLEASSAFPPQIFDIFPSAFVNMVPGIVDICSVDGDTSNLTACTSGDSSHTHHHFEFILKGVLPVQMHAFTLSIFASFVAPFGGFLASAIKRAYDLKDFDSTIPGHGGLMDRFDCQFLMAFYTWVHYNTFIKMTTVSVPKLIYMFNLLKPADQAEFLEKISQMNLK